MVFVHEQARTGRRPGQDTEKLVWKDSYCCGHPLIDSQHRGLFDLYNQLIESYYQSNSHQRVRTALYALMDYAEQHFKEEEDLLARLSYPGLLAHLREHQRMRLDISNFLADLEDNIPVLTYELLDYVRRWIGRHVRDEVRLFKGLAAT